jgi:aryl-alcohol dehydrogenase-like predicted oxidoreductase
MDVANRMIGSTAVFPVGLGAMHLSRSIPPIEPEDAERVVHAALDNGANLIDTAGAYAPDEYSIGHNERVVASALRSYGGDTSGVLVATKGGHTRTAGGDWGLDGRPEYLRAACDRSLQALGVDAIGLYQLHRPDPDVPYAESVGALGELQQAGKVRMVGISNANVELIEVARAVLGDRLVSVQNELSPRYRDDLAEIVPHCTKHQIAYLPWSPFGGRMEAAELSGRHAAFAEIGAERGVSPYQVCIAWLLAQSPVVVPIPGATRPASIADSIAGAALTLTGEERDRLDGR